MFRKPAFVVSVVSAILLFYCVALNSSALLSVSYIIFGISPFLLIWLAYTVLRFGKYEGEDLEKEEWGYQDKAKEDLWIL